MTNPIRREFWARIGAGVATMTLSALIGATFLGATMTAAGCEKKKAPPPSPPPPPPPPPKEPDPVDGTALLQVLKADARVQWASNNRVTDEGVARAIIGFADALCKGDADKVRAMLDEKSRTSLEALLGTGEWDEAVKKIEAVRITRGVGDGKMGAGFTLAIQEPSGAYALNWDANPKGGAVVVRALPSNSKVLKRASEWDNQSAAWTAAAPKPAEAAEDEGDAKPEEEQAAAPEEETKESDGIIKRTPAGPVKIPTKRPDGG